MKNKAFKNWLRREVCSTGLTQRKCAEHIGVNPQQLSKWLKGENLPNISSYKRVCLVLAEITGQSKKDLYLAGLEKIDTSKFDG
jgi:transcriptional regulator with XRE-family HTH domain